LILVTQQINSHGRAPNEHKRKNYCKSIYEWEVNVEK
jgi:hypothetical protein